jgi:hypothetical protein
MLYPIWNLLLKRREKEGKKHMDMGCVARALKIFGQTPARETKIIWFKRFFCKRHYEAEENVLCHPANVDACLIFGIASHYGRLNN